MNRLAAVYLSGPMTGRVNFNKAWFAKAEKMLKPTGMKVLNPHKFFGEDMLKKFPSWASKFAWYVAMARDLAIMVIAKLTYKSMVVYAAHDWWQSRGATVEVRLADRLGIEVIEEE